MKIIIFGGSFNPIHKEHELMLISAYKKIKADVVLLVPNFQSPFKDKRSIKINDQIAMLEIIVKKYNWLKLELYELKKSEKNYTIYTINYLQKKYGYETQYYFLLGTDQIENLHLWKDINILKNKVTFIIGNREGYNFNSIILKNYNYIHLKKTFANVSSTEIRKNGAIKYLDNKVLKYINDNGLYINERLKEHMNEERYEHCLNVSEMAKELAKKYKCDIKKAEIAGAYHDVTKQWNKEKHIKYLKKYLPYYLKEPPSTWHAVTAALFLKYNLFINDREILSAISKHTQAALKMNKLDKIVFISDKISKERNYLGVEKLRDLAFKDLDLAFKEIFYQHYNQILINCGKENINNYLKKVYKKFIS